MTSDTMTLGERPATVARNGRPDEESSAYQPVTFLDADRLADVDAAEFLGRKPYPWTNPEGLLTPQGYRRLLETLPDVSLCEAQFGMQRSHGQKSHDRYSLYYRKDLPVSAPWHAFVEELRGPAYRTFLRRMFGTRPLWLSFYWNYAPRGASVSPHCDAKRKLGSHIFYFNSDADWDPAWGGETLILDDGGRFKRESAPEFDDFTSVVSTNATGNRSLLFARRQKSWHGVRELTCPEGALRKIFLVVIDDALRSLGRRILGPLKGKQTIGY